MNIITAYIALGSNLDDPVEQIKRALKNIGQIQNTQIEKCSYFYQTPPVGYLEQPSFVNAVVSVQTTLPVNHLFSALQMIEEKQGRIRIIQNGPRIIDLDLLMYGDVILNEPHLTLPHPRMTERAFVLKPLADIAPHITLHDKKTVLEHLQRHCTKRFEILINESMREYDETSA